jgi:ABC-type siderophore export system fused ATPase/permease subunit
VNGELVMNAHKASEICRTISVVVERFMKFESSLLLHVTDSDVRHCEFVNVTISELARQLSIAIGAMRRT